MLPPLNLLLMLPSFLVGFPRLLGYKYSSPAVLDRNFVITRIGYQLSQGNNRSLKEIQLYLQRLE